MVTYLLGDAIRGEHHWQYVVNEFVLQDAVINSCRRQWRRCIYLCTEMSGIGESASRTGFGSGGIVYLHTVQLKYIEYLKNDCVLTPWRRVV